jgi:hypothetical protein
MADEKINVLIKFDSNTRALKSAITQISALKKLDNRFSSGRNIEAYAKNTARSLANVTKSWKRNFDFIDSAVKMTGKLLSGFLKLSIKGVIVEMALLGATMIGVHALFVTGQFIMKAYRGMMQMVAQGAAGATVGIAAMSAAIREQQAAIFAYRGAGAQVFGSGMNQTRMAMRNLQMDTSIATLGMENLNKAYGTMSKTMNSVQINQSTAAIKALMDFGSAGQDPAKGLEQVAVVIAALSDQKKGISDVITEAKKLGPEMEKALKDANVKTKKDFEQLLFSGDLAKKGGVSGQFAAVNSTLIGQLKSYMSQVIGTFADFGDSFLEPLKVAFEEVFYVIKRDIARIISTVKFTVGADGYFDGMVDAIDKLSNWMVNMIRQYLPAAQGMFGRMGDWFDNFRRGWNIVLEQMRPLIDGARILYKAWDPIWEAIKRGSNNLSIFKTLLIENQDDMEEFGERIGTFIDKFSEFMTGLKKMFADMAPFINDMVSGFTQIFQMLSKLMTGLAGGGLASALAPLMAFSVLGRGMQSVKGKLLPNVGAFNSQNMNVNAQNVNINGAAGPIQGGRLASGAAAGAVPYVGGGGSLSSGGTSGAADATGGALSSAMGFKTSGGNIAKRMTASDFNKIGADPRMSFSQSVIQGSRIPVLNSNIEERKAGRFAEKLNTGRGLTYAMSNLFTKRGPFMKDMANPEVRAGAVLSGMSRRELADHATHYGASGITENMSRSQLISAIKSSPGYSPAAFAESPIRPGIGEGLSNTLKSGARGMRAAGDAAQYGVRRGYGAFRGGMQYLSSGAFDAEKGEYYDLETPRRQIDDRYTQATSADGGRPGRMGRMSAGLSRMRARNRLDRNFGKFGNQFNNRFAKSAGGRMGTGMGLGLASQIAPEEMRGAMALGATVAQIDPRLGLAVAGIGGAMKAEGGLKGALSGAAGGAALGGMLGPKGALVGAGIGAVVGSIMGAINKGKAQLKAARTTAMNSIGELFTGLRAVSGYQFGQNQAALARGETLSGPGAFQGFGTGMATQLGTRRGVLENIIRRQTNAQFTAGAINPNTGRAYTEEEKEALRVENIKKAESGKFGAGEYLKEYFKTPEGRKLTGEQQKEMAKKPEEAMKTLLGATSIDVQTRLTEIDDVNNKRIDVLSKMTGKSGAELEQLAQNMGVNLYDATVDFDELVTKFTKNLRKNKDQLNAAMTDAFLGAADVYRKSREANEAVLSMDQIGRKMGDVLRGGGSEATKMGAINEGMEQLIPAILAATGGDAMKAYDAYNKLFGAGGSAFQAGGEFAGQESLFRSNELVAQSESKMRTDISGVLGTQFRGILADSNMVVDPELLEAAMLRLDPAKFNELKTQLETYDANTSFIDPMSTSGEMIETNALKAAINSGSVSSVEEYLRVNMGMGGLGLQGIAETDKEAMNAISTAAQDFSNAAVGMKTAVDLMNDQMGDFFKSPLGPDSMPDWWARGLKFDGERLMPDYDTSTPRAGGIGDTSTSKLSQTMGRHAAMDGQLTGKRTVTSSLRNYALGSPSSDHATGSAYDLTGQNLGMYARLVHSNGGFAEFHGSAANRHLHVVPGPGVGDTRTAKSVSAGSSTSASSGVTNYYTFEINGGNSSPEAIANMVMMKIKNEERSQRERS